MIKFLTLTGADDTVTPEELLKISKQYPFVEWGILLSKKRHGEPRYPSAGWLDRLSEVFHTEATKANFSLHLCGAYVREFLKGNNSFAENMGTDMMKVFNRIQINTHGEDHEWSQEEVVQMIRCMGDKQFIFQLDLNGKNEAMAKSLALANSLPNVSFLQDASSGAGIVPPYWMAPQISFCEFGYAGGLGPDNIKVELARILEVSRNHSKDIWVDMETNLRRNKKVQGDHGVRAKDSFDLDKCYSVIGQVYPEFNTGIAGGNPVIGTDVDEDVTKVTTTFPPPVPERIQTPPNPNCGVGPGPEYKAARVIELFPICDSLNMVAEFHRLFEHPILEGPGIPGIKRCELRFNLIREELQEFLDAYEKADIVEVADALADLTYVVMGAVHEFGLSAKFRAIMEEVHRSNMSKACATEHEAEETRKHYNHKTGEDHHIEPRGGLYFVYRTRDMKTVKSINYSPADIFRAIHA